MQFKRGGGGSTVSILPEVALVPLWTDQLVAKMCQHAGWKTDILPLVEEECEEEIAFDLKAADYGQHWVPRKAWCPLAVQIFEKTRPMFKRFSCELTHAFSEDELVQHVCARVMCTLRKLAAMSVDMDEEALSVLRMNGLEKRKIPSNGSTRNLGIQEPMSTEEKGGTNTGDLGEFYAICFGIKNTCRQFVIFL